MPFVLNFLLTKNLKYIYGKIMIQLTKLNGEIFYLNPHLIEKIEEKPDTVITMDSQIQYLVKEGIEEILKRIIEYRKNLGLNMQE